jgi:hypothetical protein
MSSTFLKTNLPSFSLHWKKLNDFFLQPFIFFSPSFC